jgi:hypothetical protein
MHLDRDFREFVESLIAHEVRFLIVGGYALAAHGLPRATGDLDAWVWTDSENAERVCRALESFGFTGLGLTPHDFERADRIVQLGYPPYRIDVLTSIDGVEFDDAWRNRVTVDVEGLRLDIIGRNDLIINKEASGRPQDVADVKRLRRHDPG